MRPWPPGSASRRAYPTQCGPRDLGLTQPPPTVSRGARLTYFTADSTGGFVRIFALLLILGNIYPLTNEYIIKRQKTTFRITIIENQRYLYLLCGTYYQPTYTPAHIIKERTTTLKAYRWYVFICLLSAFKNILLWKKLTNFLHFCQRHGALYV